MGFLKVYWGCGITTHQEIVVLALQLPGTSCSILERRIENDWPRVGFLSTERVRLWSMNRENKLNPVTLLRL